MLPRQFVNPLHSLHLCSYLPKYLGYLYAYFFTFPFYFNFQKTLRNNALSNTNTIVTRVKSSTHFSVDCGSANKGLFMGVAVLAGTIVSLMLFNGLFHNKKHVELALLQVLSYLVSPIGRC